MHISEILLLKTILYKFTLNKRDLSFIVLELVAVVLLLVVAILPH